MNRHPAHTSHMDSSIAVAGELYAAMIIVIGFALPLSMLMTNRVLPIFLDVFYLYLSTVGFLFMLFAEFCMLQTPTRFFDTVSRKLRFYSGKTPFARPSDAATSRLCETTDEMNATFVHQRGPTTEKCSYRQSHVATGDTVAKEASSSSKIEYLTVPNQSRRSLIRSTRSSENDEMPLPPLESNGPGGHPASDLKELALIESSEFRAGKSKSNFVLVPSIEVVEQTLTASFYLRLGVLAFGLGALVFDGIRLGELVSEFIYCRNNSPLLMIKTVAQIVFELQQMWILFKHAKVTFIRFRRVIRIGLLHLLATNIVAWIETVIEEARNHLGEEHSFSFESPHGSQLKNGSCDDKRVHIFENLVVMVTPYLSPCVVEYSLASSAVIYMLYVNVSQIHLGNGYTQMNLSDLQPDDRSLIARKASFQVDCTKSTKGLFAGLIVLVGAIVSIIIFHVYNLQPLPYSKSNIGIFFYTECCLHIILIISLINGLRQTRKLSLHSEAHKGPDVILLLAACVAVYVFEVFNIIASLGDLTHIDSITRLVNSLLSATQVTLQIFFIFDGLRRATTTREQERHKPGRGMVILVLLVNMALWLTYSFETRNIYGDKQLLTFFSFMPWSIVVSICAPLFIFFRFHSTICLAEVWKHAYTKKKHRHIDKAGHHC